MPAMPASTTLRTAILLFLAGLALYALPAFRRDLWNPDEPRYAEIAREMAASREWLIPRLNGATFLEEPPLQHWLAVAAGAGRVSAVSARVPAAIAGALALSITFLLGTWLFSRWVGLAGALILGTTYEFWWLAGRAQVDMPLSVCVLAAIAGFAASERFPRWRVPGLAVLYGASAVGFLAKGLLGAGLPGLAVVSWLLWERRSLRGHWIHLVAGALFLLLVIAGWGFVLGRHGGEGMLSEYFVKQHLGRFSGGEDHQEPFYYYLWAFPMAFLPWTLLWPVAFAGLRGAFGGPGSSGQREEARWARLLAAWFLSGFLVFTAASTKRETYLLPIFPPAALLVAVGLERAWNRLAIRRMLRENGTAFAAFAALLVAGLVAIPVVWKALGWKPDAVAIGTLLAAGAILAWRLRPRRWREGETFPLAAPTLLALVLWAISMAAFPAVDTRKSARPMAEAIGRLAGTDPIYLFDMPEGSIGNYTFYLERTLPNLTKPEDVARAVAGHERAIFILREKSMQGLEQVVGTPLTVVVREQVGHRWMVAASLEPGKGKRGSAR